MELAAAKMIGAGLACIALVGAGIGIGNVFGSYLAGALRNPGAAATQTTNLLLGFALCEATGLFGLVIALIILFTCCSRTRRHLPSSLHITADSLRSMPRLFQARSSGSRSRFPSSLSFYGVWQVR